MKTPNLGPLSVMCLVAQSCLTLGPHGLQPIRLLYPWRFSMQEYWSVLLRPPPGNLPNFGIKPRPLHCSEFLTVCATSEALAPI